MDAMHLDPKDLPIEIFSSDDSVISVQNGRITALRPGAVRLTARCTLAGITAEDSIGLCVAEI